MTAHDGEPFPGPDPARAPGSHPRDPDPARAPDSGPPDPDRPEAEADQPERGDPELIAAARTGDRAAFATLYTRHVASARRLALALARHPSDADDLVAEAFAKLLSTLREGGGPEAAFRAYLLTTVRNLWYDRTRRDRKVTVTDDLSGHDAGVPFDDPAVAGFERTLVARAFARLPERWQTVLWHTEVEGEAPAAVAPILELTPNGVSALAYRARERLRQNYLQEHLTTYPTDECRSTVDRLGAYVRSGLSQRDRASVDEHLSECRRCQLLYVELGDLNRSLRELLAMVVLGEGTAALYIGSAAAGAGAGGLAAFFAGSWVGTKQLARRRSTQAGAGAAVVAGAVALALVLTSGSPPPDSDPDPPPVPGAVAPDDPADPPAPEPDPETPVPTGDPDQLPGEDPELPPAPGLGLVDLEVALEPVGALVRDRPGVLAMTVAAIGLGGAGGEAPAPMRLSGPRGAPTVQPAAAVSGPLTAVITVPDGVELRSGEPGNGWRCESAGAGIRCERGPLAAGGTSLAHVPVAVSATAAAGTPRVRLTAPGIEASAATAATGVTSDGLAAVFAGVMPATVVAGGNALLSCPALDLTCKAAREGRGALGRDDNGDYLMTRYADPRAPAGAPHGAAVSGARITVPGNVVWAGLFWAGSGRPPSSPTAHLRVPGGSRYTPVAAGTVRRASHAELGQPAYQAAADVTSLVRGSRGGDWWVAVDGKAFAGGLGGFGGWALMVVAEDGGPDRSVAVFDELTPLRNQGSFSAALYGGPGRARFGFIGWEGDRGLTGDQLLLDGTALGGTDRTNVAASRADGTGAGRNTFGTDARVLDATISSGGDPTITATTGRDAWLLGPVVVISPPP